MMAMNRDMHNDGRLYAKIAAGFVLIAVFVVIVLPLMTPHDPYAVDLQNALLPPSAQYPLGTDALGRCVLSRIMVGARVSLGIAALLVVSMATIGILLGLFSGYCGGTIDAAVMRIVDVFLAFPNMVLALAIAGTLGPGLVNTAIAIGATGWTKYARFVRGLVLQERTKNYVATARMSGAGRLRVLTVFILPNIIPQILTMAAVDLGGVLLGIAGMSFLGLGVQPPTAEWGYMICEGRSRLESAPWISLFPGLAIFLTAFVANWLSDYLRDQFDPRHAKKGGEPNGRGLRSSWREKYSLALIGRTTKQ